MKLLGKGCTKPKESNRIEKAAKANMNWEAGQSALKNIIAMLGKDE